MKIITRRNFLKTLGKGLAGTLLFPEMAIAEKEGVKKELIKKILEPNLKELTKKIIEIESNWEYWAVSKNNAIGLMQVKPIVLEEWNEYGEGRLYNKYDLFDPFINVKVGEWYLHDRIKNHYLPYYNLKKSEENMAASYNAGPTTLGEVGDAIKNFHKLPEETKKYLHKLWKLT